MSKQITVYPIVKDLMMVQVYADAFARADREGLWDKYAINTVPRITHFLAQTFVESGQYKYVRENMSYSASRILEVFGKGKHSAAITSEEATVLAHQPSALAERVYGVGNPTMAGRLGNYLPGDGWTYRGGGAIQLTGRNNYNAYDVDPDAVGTAEEVLECAMKFWSRNELNEFADINYMRELTRVINGGYNGLAEREGAYQRFFPKVLAHLSSEGTNAVTPPTFSLPTTANSLKDVATLQRALNLLGAKPELVVDGIAGPATTRAIITFQTENSLFADGIAGADTRNAIMSKLRLRAGAATGASSIALTAASEYGMSSYLVAVLAMLAIGLAVLYIYRKVRK